MMLLDHPEADLPLITVLSRAPFSFTEEELSRIRLGLDGKHVLFSQAFTHASEADTPLGNKCRAALNRLEGWRFQSTRMRLPDFLWFLLSDASLYAMAGVSEQAAAARQNLRSFCVQAENAAERGISTLRDFLDFLTEQAAGGETRAASALGSGDDVVRLMTMHKSKGLQFPVVFCLGLEKGLKGKPGGEVQLDEELGLCLRYKVPRVRLSRKSPADEIFEWKKNHDVKAEKICLLYVAMTRAQERLYLVGTETDRALWHMPPGEHRALAASDYMDLILPSLLDDEKKSTACAHCSKPWKITVFDRIQQEKVESEKVFHNLLPWLHSLLSAPPVDELWKIDSDRTGPEEEENRLKKYAVSALLQQARNRIFMEDEQTPEEKRTPEEARRQLQRVQTPRWPSFLAPDGEAGGAVRGTVIHRFLSLVNLDEIRAAEKADRAVLRSLLDELVDRRIFTAEEASWIRLDAVERFLDYLTEDRGEHDEFFTGVSGQ